MLSRLHTMFSCVSDSKCMKLLICQAWQSTESDTNVATRNETLNFKGGAKWVWWQLHLAGTGSCDPVSGKHRRNSTIMGILATCIWPSPVKHHCCPNSLHPEPSHVVWQCTVTMPTAENHWFSLRKAPKTENSSSCYFLFFFYISKHKGKFT